MPALFNKDDILNGTDKEVTIFFSDLYEIPEGVDDPFITILITDESREFQQKMWKKFVKPRIVSKGSGFQLVTPDKQLEYVMQLLQKCMTKTEGVIDEFSLPLMRKQLSRSKTITTFLAERLTKAFEDDGLELKKQEEDDEKN